MHGQSTREQCNPDAKQSALKCVLFRVIRVQSVSRFATDHLVFNKLLSGVQPVCQRGFTLAAASAGKQPINADMLIQIRPLNCIAIAKQHPMLLLVCSCVQQPRIPHKRDAQEPPIAQVHNDLIVTDFYRCGRGVGLKHQSSHSTPPVYDSHVSPSSAVSHLPHAQDTRDLRPRAVDQAIL